MTSFSTDNPRTPCGHLCPFPTVANEHTEALKALAKTVHTEMNNALAEVHSSVHAKIATEVDSRELPVPFPDPQACEAFLQLHENTLVLIAGFQHSVAALKYRKRVINEGTGFRIHCIMEYLMTTEDMLQLNYTHLGPATVSFIIEMSRWLMGPNWINKGADYIKQRIQKYLWNLRAREEVRTKALQQRQRCTLTAVHDASVISDMN